MKWLSDYGVAINAIAITFLVVVTLLYAIFTQKLVVENRKLREMYKQPYIYLYIEKSDIPFYYLILGNLGGGPAKKIEFEIQPDIKMLNNENLSTVINTVKYLHPSQKYYIYLGNKLLENSGDELKNECKIKISFVDDFGKRMCEEFLLNPTVNNYVFQERNYELREIAAELKLISQNLEKINAKRP